MKRHRWHGSSRCEDCALELEVRGHRSSVYRWPSGSRRRVPTVPPCPGPPALVREVFCPICARTLVAAFRRCLRAADVDCDRCGEKWRISWPPLEAGGNAYDEILISRRSSPTAVRPMGSV